MSPMAPSDPSDDELLFDYLRGLVGFFKCFTQTIYSDEKLYVIRNFWKSIDQLTKGWVVALIKRFDLWLDKGKGSIMESTESGGTIHLII